MSYTRNLLHIVINTKNREITIGEAHCEDLYRYITSIISDEKCRLLRINGIENHVHMLIDLHPVVALAKLIQEIKQNTSLWMKRSGLFPDFSGWGAEYYACSISPKLADTVIDYIVSQKLHHGVRTYEDELQQLFASSGSPWRENLMM